RQAADLARARDRAGVRRAPDGHLAPGGLAQQASHVVGAGDVRVGGAPLHERALGAGRDAADVAPAGHAARDGEVPDRRALGVADEALVVGSRRVYAEVRDAAAVAVERALERRALRAQGRPLQRAVGAAAVGRARQVDVRVQPYVRRAGGRV